MNSFRVVNTVSRRMMTSGVHQPFPIKPKFTVPKSAGMAVSNLSFDVPVFRCVVLCALVLSFDMTSLNSNLLHTHILPFRHTTNASYTSSITNTGYGNKIVGHQPRSSSGTRWSWSIRCRDGCPRSYEGNDYQHWCGEG